MEQLEELMCVLGRLKDLPRSGWLRKNVEGPESVAAHSYGVILLTFLLAPSDLDKYKCLKMAIIHDLQEALVGDITPFDGVTKKEKNNLEKQAVKELAKKLDFPELENLFSEYEAMKTPEAIFVKDIDRLEAVLQAKYYDNNNRSQENLVDEFSQYAKKCMSGKNLEISDILDKLSS
jgi:putative hydrolase of HD superfamily